MKIATVAFTVVISLLLSACEAQPEREPMRVGLLEIVASSEQSEGPDERAQLYLNGTPLGMGQSLMQVPAGEYTVRAELPGHPPQEQEVSFDGTDERVEFHFDADAEQP